MESRNVLLMTREDKTANVVSFALKENPSLTLAGVCRDVPELKVLLSSAAGRPAVLADIDADPAKVLRSLSTISKTHPEVIILVISSVFNEKLILEAMQAGARHFLRKESLASELDQVLEGILGHEQEQQVKSGDIISVFSSSGGCGATTVAINMASELRLASSEPVLVVDLDSCYGAVSSYLGITGRYGIGHVLGHSQIDKHLIESSAYAYADDFSVLQSPASAQDDGHKSPRYENLADALEACRSIYKYTVVDAPRLPESIAKALAGISKYALVVFQLTVKDLRMARSTITSFMDSGISRDRIIAVANRVSRRGTMIRAADSKKATGVDHLYEIRSDWRKAIKCVNLRQPVAKVAKKSGLRRDYLKLAAKLSSSKRNGYDPTKG